MVAFVEVMVTQRTPSCELLEDYIFPVPEFPLVLLSFSPGTPCNPVKSRRYYLVVNKMKSSFFAEQGVTRALHH